MRKHTPWKLFTTLHLIKKYIGGAFHKDMQVQTARQKNTTINEALHSGWKKISVNNIATPQRLLRLNKLIAAM
jgi:hypothetical protein